MSQGFRGENNFLFNTLPARPLCANFHEISGKQIKNHISQCKITQNLGHPPTIIHNIVKRFGESGEISVHVGQGRIHQVNVHDL